MGKIQNFPEFWEKFENFLHFEKISKIFQNFKKISKIFQNFKKISNFPEFLGKFQLFFEDSKVKIFAIKELIFPLTHLSLSLSLSISISLSLAHITPSWSPPLFHRHHIHSFALNCEQLASIYTFPSFAFIGGDSTYSQLALIISCTFSDPMSQISSDTDDAAEFCFFVAFPFWISTTWICGSCDAPLPSIRSIEVVVVGVVGAFDENRMLKGWRFVNF